MKHPYRAMAILLSSACAVLVGWFWLRSPNVSSGQESSPKQAHPPVMETPRSVPGDANQTVACASIVDNAEWQQLPKLEVCLYEKQADGTLVAASLDQVNVECLSQLPQNRRPGFEANGVSLAGEAKPPAGSFELGVVPATYAGKGTGLLLLGETYRISNVRHGGEVRFTLPSQLEAGTHFRIDYLVNQQKEAPPPPAPVISGCITEPLPAGSTGWIVAYSQRPRSIIDDYKIWDVARPNPDGSFRFEGMRTGGDLVLYSVIEGPVDKIRNGADGKVRMYKRKVPSDASFRFPADADMIFREEGSVECQFKFPEKLTIYDIYAVNLYLKKDDILPVFTWDRNTDYRHFNVTKIACFKAPPGEYWAMALADYDKKTPRDQKILSEMKITVSADPEKNVFIFPKLQTENPPPPAFVAPLPPRKPPFIVSGHIDEMNPANGREWQALLASSPEGLWSSVGHVLYKDGTFKLNGKPGSMLCVYSLVNTGQAKLVAMFKENITQPVSLNFPADADYVVRMDQAIDCKIKIPAGLRPDLGVVVVGPPAPSRLPLYVWNQDSREKTKEDRQQFLQTGDVNLKVMPGKYLAHVYQGHRKSFKDIVEEIGTLEMTVTADPQKNVFEFKPGATGAKQDHPAEPGPKQGNQPIDE